MTDSTAWRFSRASSDETPMIPRECKRLAEVDFPIAAVSQDHEVISE